MFVLPMLDAPTAPALLAAARQRGIVTLLDACYGLGPNRDILEAALPFCDVVLPSYDDMLHYYRACSLRISRGPCAQRAPIGSC